MERDSTQAVYGCLFVFMYVLIACVASVVFGIFCGIGYGFVLLLIFSLAALAVLIVSYRKEVGGDGR